MTGFDEVKRRLDSLNGSVARHDEEIVVLREQMAEHRGDAKATIAMARDLLAVLALGIAAWQGLSSHQALKATPAPAAQGR